MVPQIFTSIYGILGWLHLESNILRCPWRPLRACPLKSLSAKTGKSPWMVASSPSASDKQRTRTRELPYLGKQKIWKTGQWRFLFYLEGRCHRRTSPIDKQILAMTNETGFDSWEVSPLGNPADRSPISSITQTQEKKFNPPYNS